MKTNLPLTISHRLLYLAAIVEGFSVMSLQILGSRAISPYYGSSIYMWTLVLGSTLIALSVGYFIGGHLSRRPNHDKLLIKLFLVASGAFILLSLTFKNLLIRYMDVDVQSTGILMILLTIFSPLIFCGMLSPVIIKNLNLDSTQSGEDVGRIFGLISVGGILGAFITGFYIIPVFGTTIGLKVTATVLAIYPVILFFSKRKIIIGIGISVFVFLLLSLNPKLELVQQKGSISVVYASESISGNLMVADNTENQNRILYMNHMAQTNMHFTGRSLWAYVYRIATFASTKPEGSDALIAGIGGGNLINELHRLKFNIDAVEIDPRIGDIAKEFFKMTDEANIIVDDARHYINTCNKQYDVIVLDLSSGEVMPTNVYTIESFKKIRSLLKPNGLLFLHYLCSLDKKQVPALLAIGNTLRQAGFSANILDSHPELNSDRTQEFMFLASQEPLDFSSSKFRIEPDVPNKLQIAISGDIYLSEMNFQNGILLSDDLPILDELQKEVIFKLRSSSKASITAPLIKLGHQIQR